MRNVKTSDLCMSDSLGLNVRKVWKSSVTNLTTTVCLNYVLICNFPEIYVNTHQSFLAETPLLIFYIFRTDSTHNKENSSYCVV